MEKGRKGAFRIRKEKRSIFSIPFREIENIGELCLSLVKYLVRRNARLSSLPLGGGRMIAVIAARRRRKREDLSSLLNS